MNYTTWIEIDRSNLEHNVSVYKSWIPHATAIAPVIKGNAYGHGLSQIGYLHDQNKLVARLCVANSTEALLLRQHNIKKPILVLSYVTPDHLEEVIMNHIDVAVTDLQTIKILNKAALKLNKKLNIHLKIDTGMSRLGFFPHQVTEIVHEIKKLPGLHLQGIFSHLSSSNKPKIVHEQEKIFEPFRSDNVELHITNSLGTLNCTYQYDFARIGLGLYGYILTKNKVFKQALKPVLSLKTRIIHIKQIEKNAHLGYQQQISIKKTTKIAILGIGYFDGLSPDFANHGYVLIHGKFAPILTINMNLTTVDITNIPECMIHDAVTILGEQDGKIISGYDWQSLLNRNMRMFFAGLDASLPRIIVHSQQQIATHQSSHVTSNEFSL